MFWARRAEPWLATAADASAGQGKAKELGTVDGRGRWRSPVAATPSQSMLGVVQHWAWCVVVVGSLSTSHVGSVNGRVWRSAATLAVERASRGLHGICGGWGRGCAVVFGGRHGPATFNRVATGRNFMLGRGWRPQWMHAPSRERQS